MTPDIVSRAVWGLALAALTCILGIIILAATGNQSSTSLTALASLGSASLGALAGLLSNVSSPGAILGGRRATDPKPVPVEVVAEVLEQQETAVAEHSHVVERPEKRRLS